MIAGFTSRRAELAVRAVRDNLADCLVTLPALLDPENAASLHFWFANFDGLRRELFPLLAGAYDHYLASANPAALYSAVAAGHEHWLAVARRLPTLDEETIAALVGDHTSVAL
jgi:hypothetical protein